MTFDELVATRVRPLAEALVKQGLRVVRIRDVDFEIELSREGRAPAAGQQPAEPAPDVSRPTLEYDVLTSEVVGRVRFLRPAISAGSYVEGDRELGFVETLGVRNPIRSRGSGRVAVVYVEEGQAVDYGAPLIAIER